MHVLGELSVDDFLRDYWQKSRSSLTPLNWSLYARPW